MKRIIACLLTIALLIGMCLPVCAKAPMQTPVLTAAESAAVEALAQGDYPVVFVTGIGQVRYYLTDEDGNIRKDKDGKDIRYNLLYADTDAFKQPKMILATLRAATELILSAALRKNVVSKDNLETIARGLFRANILDENGKVPDDVLFFLREKPLSQYTEAEKGEFFSFIPCKDLVPIIGAENIYCFNHSAFGYLYDDAEELDRYITEVVKPQSGKDKVILIPMSMGAAVVSAYLSRHENDRDDILRVVSIVGCWDGSDLLADLVEQKYRSDAPELLYNGLIIEMFENGDRPWLGYLIELLLRAYPKTVLRGIIDRVLSALSETLILPATSLLALIPHERYPAIESTVLAGDKWENVRTRAREYYTAQCTLTERLHKLESKGVEFFFICGYGLTFGELTEDYRLCQFMESSVTTNSDEIIPICSTAPGTNFVPHGSAGVFDGAYASPDGTIDLSTSFAPDRTWCFNRQIHQLDYNNTALRLAMHIALGNVRDVQQSADDFPQFNDSRDLSVLIRNIRDNYLVLLQTYIRDNASVPERADDVRRAAEAKARCEETLESTHNDREAEDQMLAETKALLIELGMLEPDDPPHTPTAADRFFKWLNDLSVRFFGAQGYPDGLKSK